MEYFVVGIAFSNTLLPDKVVIVWASLTHVYMLQDLASQVWLKNSIQNQSYGVNW